MCCENARFACHFKSDSMLSPANFNQGSFINSRLSRLNTARGSGTDFVTVGPAKVKACKSLLFTIRRLWHWNNIHLVNEVNTLFVLLLTTSVTLLCLMFLCHKITQPSTPFFMIAFIIDPPSNSQVDKMNIFQINISKYLIGCANFLYKVTIKHGRVFCVSFMSFTYQKLCFNSLWHFLNESLFCPKFLNYNFLFTLHIFSLKQVIGHNHWTISTKTFLIFDCV